MSSPMRKGELDLGLHLSCGEIHAEEAPTRGVERKLGVAQQASPWWLNSSSTMIGGSMDFSFAQPVGSMVSSESITGARHCMPPPAANKLDPLQLSIAPHVPAINLNLNLSLSLDPQVPAINLNLAPPPQSQAAPVPNNTWLSMKTPNPFEPPLRTIERVTRKDAQFGPFILEYAQRQREAAAAANMKRVLVEEEVDAGPAAKRRYYSCPSETVAKINEMIEQLKKEALCRPAQRRSISVIQAEIDKLQGLKDLIHARVSGQLLGDGQGSSRAPPSGN